jgi:hypothetical protein
LFRECGIKLGESKGMPAPSIIKRCLVEDTKKHQKSIKKFNYKQNSGKSSGNPLKFKDFETYRQQNKNKLKKEIKKGSSKILKGGSQSRRSFDGRKSVNFTSDDHFKASYDDFSKMKQKENISYNIANVCNTQKKTTSKMKYTISPETYTSEEERSVEDNSKLKRAQSSKPLGISLKDLECVKKLKDKMTKKTKPKPVQPKMYISDRPAKPRKKKTTASSTVRHLYNTTSKEVSSQRMVTHETSKKDLNKVKNKNKKKKKVMNESKRASMSSETLDSLKSGLIQTSKFSTFEHRRKKDTELSPISGLD